MWLVGDDARTGNDVRSVDPWSWRRGLGRFVRYDEIGVSHMGCHSQGECSRQGDQSSHRYAPACFRWFCYARARTGIAQGVLASDKMTRWGAAFAAMRGLSRHRNPQVGNKGVGMARSHQEQEETPEVKELLRAVGARIRDLRNQKNISQRDLAESSELRATYLAQIELAGVNLTLKLLLQLSQALGVQPRDLLPAMETGEDPEVKLSVVRSKIEDSLAGLRKLEAEHTELLILIDDPRKSRQ
jgi:transcriptional regulator with XRE-family HTH domain